MEDNVAVYGKERESSDLKLSSTLQQTRGLVKQKLQKLECIGCQQFLLLTFVDDFKRNVKKKKDIKQM